MTSEIKPLEQLVHRRQTVEPVVHPAALLLNVRYVVETFRPSMRISNVVAVVGATRVATNYLRNFSITAATAST